MKIKIPDNKFSFSRVISMLEIVLPIFFFLILLFLINCNLYEFLLYFEEYPEIVETCFSVGILYTFLFFVLIDMPYFIHGGLRKLKEDKSSE